MNVGALNSMSEGRKYIFLGTFHQDPVDLCIWGLEIQLYVWVTSVEWLRKLSFSNHFT